MDDNFGSKFRDDTIDRLFVRKLGIFLFPAIVCSGFMSSAEQNPMVARKPPKQGRSQVLPYESGSAS
jgi:hypothetical protein